MTDKTKIHSAFLMSRLKEAMERKGWQYKELSEHTGLDVSKFSHWDTRGHLPNSEALLKVSDALEISPHYLLHGQESYRLEELVSFEDHELIKSIINIRGEFKITVTRKI